MDSRVSDISSPGPVHRFRKPWILLGAVLLELTLLLSLISPSPLRADGGTLRVANVAMGAYRINVFTAPTPITPDSVDVSVLATFERGRGVARNLEILVICKLLDGSGTQVTHTATREEADDPRYYAAKFPLGAVGKWEMEVRVRGSEGEGSVTFQVQVQEPGFFQNPFLVLAVAFVPLLLVGAWLKLGSRSESPGER
jgi:hypothetical protein